AVRHNITALLTAPIRGVVVLGSNGEAPLVGDDDSVRVIDAARSVVPDGRPLIAGTGRESTLETIRFTARAARAGADAALVRTPSFFKAQLTADAFLGHYTRLADASPIPILLYNYTALTGVTLPPDAVAVLAAHPNIIGMKESGTDEALIGAYGSHAGDDFRLLGGTVTALHASLSAGATGAILAAAVVAPRQCVELFDLFRAGQTAGALALQARIVELNRYVTSTYGVAGLKLAQDLVGQRGGAPRLPMLPPPDGAREPITAQLRALGALEN
ncbi:MAG: dihydrodipicolinate synthase family protein, partial [Acidobacteriota bacterium]|nr:dihydrodipicolinate synthase family protein [Acidobacteriota bacterium]